MAVILIGLGVLLLVFTFLLAFTLYGELSAIVGVAAILGGALLLARRSSRPQARPPRCEP